MRGPSLAYSSWSGSGHHRLSASISSYHPPKARCACLTVGRRSLLKPPRALPRLAFRIPIRSGRRILARAAPAHELHRAPDFGRACPTSSPCSTAAWMRVRGSRGRVPEAAVDENSPPPRLVGEIGLAWKIRDMDAEASAERMYCGPGFRRTMSGYPPPPTLPHKGGGSNRRPHQIQRLGRLATSWCAATAPDVAIILAAWEAEIIYD